MALEVSEREGKWHVGEMSFDSQHAAQLYAQSRALGANFSLWQAFKLLPWYVKAVLIIMVLSGVSALMPKSSPPDGKGASITGAGVDMSAPVPGRAELLMRKAEEVALLLNMNGQLCARVTKIEYLHGKLYNVTCIRYRDGTGSATYELNLENGQAK